MYLLVEVYETMRVLNIRTDRQVLREGRTNRTQDYSVWGDWYRATRGERNTYWG